MLLLFDRKKSLWKITQNFFFSRVLLLPSLFLVSNSRKSSLAIKQSHKPVSNQTRVLAELLNRCHTLIFLLNFLICI